MLATRAAVHVIRQRRAQRRSEPPRPAKRELRQLRAVLTRRLRDRHGSERTLQLTPSIRQHTKALRPHGSKRPTDEPASHATEVATPPRPTRLPEPEHQPEPLTVEPVTNRQFQDLPMCRSESFRLRPLQRVKLGPPQIPLQRSQRSQRSARIGRTTRRTQPTRDRTRRSVRTPAPARPRYRFQYRHRFR